MAFTLLAALLHIRFNAAYDCTVSNPELTLHNRLDVIEDGFPVFGIGSHAMNANLCYFRISTS